jgi:hypothetical protein
MMGVTIVPARRSHIAPIAARMRAIDRRETEAFGRTPRQALRVGLAGSVLCCTALVDGVPQAMFGVVPGSAIDRRGQPWFLGSDEVMRHGRALLAIGRPIVTRMRAECGMLGNFISCENHRAIALLRRWGFAIGAEAVTFGGMPFFPFWSENDV